MSTSRWRGAGASEPSLSPSELEERLGYRFRDPGLLAQALTHSSVKDEEHPSNERLEFLGDAVLGQVAAHFLYSAFPELQEGQLTRMRSAVVSAEPLARFALELGLDQALHIGRGLRRDALSTAVLADVVEAVIGAAYLDGGLEAVRPLILWGLAGAIEDELAQRSARNWKSQLQEYTQQVSRVTPTYEVVSERGPDHHKEFVVAALVDGIERGRGQEPSKKAAEQAAAREAFQALCREGPGS